MHTNRAEIGEKKLESVLNGTRVALPWKRGNKIVVSRQARFFNEKPLGLNNAVSESALHFFPQLKLVPHPIHGMDKFRVGIDQSDFCA